MADNCSDFPPFSEVYLDEVSVTEQVFIGISTALCVGVLLLFLDKVVFIHRHYGNYGQPKLIKHKSLVLVGIYPVVAMTSVLALYIPRSKLLCDFVAAVYLAVCLYQFTSLIILYFGGIAELINKTRSTGFVLRAPPCCCCCCCCPTVQVTAKNLTRLQQMVLQTAFLQPIVSFVSVVLWLDGKYNPYVTTVSSAATYLSLVGVVSTLLAMYGLLVLYRSTRSYLATHSVTPKFLVLQLVLIAQNLQKFILKLMADNGVPPCSGQLSSSVRADGIHHMLVIAEMCLLAFFARMLYRKPTMQEMAEGYTGVPEENVSQSLCSDKVLQNGDAGQNSGRSYNSMDNRNPEQSTANKMDGFSFSDSD